jgi:hypothetical protein
MVYASLRNVDPAAVNHASFSFHPLATPNPSADYELFDALVVETAEHANDQQWSAKHYTQAGQRLANHPLRSNYARGN